MRFNTFNSKSISVLKNILELCIIAIWAIWIGKGYLDMRLDMWPSNGGEYMMTLQNEYNWTLLPECGYCFFWNGFTNGGAPSFVDLHSGWLHPIAIFSTFIFGVFNSGKIIVILSLILAGFAQWWLGKIFELSRFTRITISLILVASGALAGRMQIGNVPLVLSTAACILVLPALFQLIIYGGYRATVILGAVLGLAILSGQGYLQIGLLICLIPMVFFILHDSDPNGMKVNRTTVKNILFATVLGCLVAAPLLVPFAHFYPMFTKDTDPLFSSSQPFQYNFLNLVINDFDFYQSETLGRQPFPYLYLNYIGWVPILFSIWGLIRPPQKFRKITVGFCIAIIFVYLSSSAVIFKYLNMVFPDTMAGIRNPGPIQGLAVPFILILAGLGIDNVLKLELPNIGLATFPQNKFLWNINLNIVKWGSLIVILALSLKSDADFSQSLLYVAKLEGNFDQLITPMKTKEAQWVQPPYGEYFWLPSAMKEGIKIRAYFRPWNVIAPEMPMAYLEMSINENDMSLPEFDKRWGDFFILKRPDNQYAYITSDDKIIPCQAHARGGIINVDCDSSIAGKLTVIEHALDGWNVSIDGVSRSLNSDAWLSVDADAGKHHYIFQYQPWDAPLGIIFGIIGWIIVIVAYIYLSINGDKSSYPFFRQGMQEDSVRSS